MKILVLASTLDLRYRLGCTPAWWQLLKALHESGNEVIAIPYLGDPVETPWWRTYENPCSTESKLANRATKNNNVALESGALSRKISKTLIDRRIRPKWRRHLRKVLEQERDVDGIFLMNIPHNHITGIMPELKRDFGVKAVYYDGDMPTILPQYAMGRGFKFSYYEGADLTEYDAFFSNSKGVIPDLEKLGAKNVRPLYYAADPDLFQPVAVAQDRDVAFYGHGNEFREDWLNKMVTEPSRAMNGTRFIVGGKGFTMTFGDAEVTGPVSIAAFGRFAGRAKINLNITRHSHTSVYASATARPFELAAYGACIVSQPYEGIEEWFAVGKELVVVKSADEAREAYERLLASPAERMELGARAREAIVTRHTYRHRAAEVVKAVGS